MNTVQREAPFLNVLFPYGHWPKGGGGGKGLPGGTPDESICVWPIDISHFSIQILSIVNQWLKSLSNKKYLKGWQTGGDQALPQPERTVVAQAGGYRLAGRLLLVL